MKFRQDYTVVDLVYVNKTDISSNLDYKKHLPYRITEVFSNSIVLFQTGANSKQIIIRGLELHFRKIRLVPQGTSLIFSEVKL